MQINNIFFIKVKSWISKTYGPKYDDEEPTKKLDEGFL